MTMKQLFVLIGLLLGMSVNSQTQELQANYNVASYFAQDSTTFFLGAAKGKKLIQVDFTSVNQDDIEMRVGSVISEQDGTKQSAGNLDFYPQGTATAVDSVILSTTTYTQTIKNSAGTRYTTSRIYLHFPDGIPTDFVAITFFWGTAESGRVKIYF